MRKIILVCAAFCVISFPAAAQNDHSPADESIDGQGILAIAKIAGACGILDSMIDFQAKTKMEGGDEFVTRFWQVEAARLGKTVEELSNTCNGAISTYDKFWDATEQ